MTATITVTPMQAAILAELIRDGANNQCIANRLHVTPNTIKCQLHRTLNATGFGDRTGLVVALLRGTLRVTVRDGRRRSEGRFLPDPPPPDLPDGLQPGDVVVTTSGGSWEVVDVAGPGWPVLAPIDGAP